MNMGLQNVINAGNNLFNQRITKKLSDKFQYTCKHCKEKFTIKPLKNLLVEDNEAGIRCQINILECFAENTFVQTVSTKNGSATMNVKELSTDVKCTECKHKESYLVSEITPILNKVE